MLENPRTDALTGKIAPCNECWEVIQELLNKPLPYIQEDPTPILSKEALEYSLEELLEIQEALEKAQEERAEEEIE